MSVWSGGSFMGFGANSDCREIHANADSGHRFVSNKVSNTKYTLLSFLPLNLMEQFSQNMNRYFLFIACLQLVHTITPVHPASTWVPLITVVLLSALKEGYDDWCRYRRDRRTNQTRVRVVKSGAVREVAAEAIRVGDLVCVRGDEAAPCDICIVATANRHGSCFIQTSNLDGESDYKPRTALAETHEFTTSPRNDDDEDDDVALLNEPHLVAFQGKISCNHPNADVYEFNAQLNQFNKHGTLSLSARQLIQQSAVVKYCDWVWGVAVYTGNETKLGMNKNKPHMKWTATEGFINKLSGFVFSFQLATVLVFGFVGNYLKHHVHTRMGYLEVEESDSHFEAWYMALIVPARFLLLCSMMIPISLKVTLDFVRAFYAKLIDWDQSMFDEEQGKYSQSNNTAISEDLGQVEVVLTDKTGTLTQNRMLLKKCVIVHPGTNEPEPEQLNAVRYGDHADGDVYSDSTLRDCLQRGQPTNVVLFFRALALCHSVVPRMNEDGTFEYRSSSPDEEALVKAAERLGVRFVSRKQDLIRVDVRGEVEEYEVLHTLQFSSVRKRMSVVLRERKKNRILLLCKGADDTVLPCLRRENTAREGERARVLDQLHAALESFSEEGLRTLCVAWRPISPEIYASFCEAHDKANSQVHHRTQSVEAVYEHLEKDLQLLGATAIEDKLQERVPETIAELRRAGLRFWMLTGDKTTTAIQIATACNLHVKGHALVSLRGTLADDNTEQELRDALAEDVPHGRTVVVTSRAIRQIMLNDTLRALFLKLCLSTDCVLCCRVTPLQKAMIVRLAKESGMRTLAIGDGGNDVNMIQEAHVGVGIEGREGQQAARAADYSISKFRFLEQLMLVHGRLSFHRTAFIAQYSFYKSLVLCFIQLMYAVPSSFSGASLFNSLSLMTYNVLYTGLLACFVVFDRDLEPATLMAHPEAFKGVAHRALLNWGTFAGWFLRALYQAAAIFFCVFHAMSTNAFVSADGGHSLGDEEISLVAFSCLVVLQLVTITLESHTVTTYNAALLLGTLGAFFVFNVAFSSVPRLSMFGLMFHVLPQPVFWLTLVLTVVVAALPVVCVQYWRGVYHPTARQSLRQSLLLGGARARVDQAGKYDRVRDDSGVEMQAV